MSAAPAPRGARAPRGALAVVLLATFAVAPGCVSRGRPLPRTSPRPVPGARLGDTIDAFARARAGETLDVLVLSGGGQNGAFGAGVLAGWRAAGRPPFDVVTGVSAGALLATHAFLGGPADDGALRAATLDLEASDVLCPRSPLSLPFGASAYDFGPLARGIARTFDDPTIDRVAAASGGGRRLLLVATTDLDSGALAVWDLGALARARDYARYRDVLLASSSPPLLAEPRFLDGVMHADGGILANVYVPEPPPGIRFRTAVVVNGLLSRAPACVEGTAFSIGKRAVDLALSAATIGALWQVHGVVTRGGGAFRVVSIPDALRTEADDLFAFEPTSIRALYDAGTAMGRDPTSWAVAPPTIGGR